MHSYALWVFSSDLGFTLPFFVRCKCVLSVFPPPHPLTLLLPAVCSAEEDDYDDDDNDNGDDDDDDDDDDDEDDDDDGDDVETIMLLPQALPIFSRSRKLGTRAFFFVTPQRHQSTNLRVKNYFAN